MINQPAEEAENVAVQERCLESSTPGHTSSSGGINQDRIELLDRQWRPLDSSLCDCGWNAAPTIRLRGRIDADSIWCSQSAANIATFGVLPNVVGLRRARIGIQGDLSSDKRYLLEIDLASGSVAVEDVFVGFGAIQDRGELRLGHMREPFSLEGFTSANSFAFLERSPVNTLDPARNWGLGLFRCNADESATFAAGVFHSGGTPSELHGGLVSETAVTARCTMLGWYEDKGARLMHLGLALSARYPDSGFVVINQRPRSPLLNLSDSSESAFVPTIRIPANLQEIFNAQWALVNGPFWAQAEWYGTLIEPRGTGAVFFHGSYVSFGYFLTGERHSYQKREGVLGAVKVARPFLRGFSSQPHSHCLGRGAWELTARFSYQEFFDQDTPNGPQGQLVGVDLAQATFGVNWYLADRMRLMFNYNYCGPTDPNVGGSAASVFAMRMGMFW